MKKFSSQKGFTLIETLVAVTILMISIAGPLTIAYKSYAAAVTARDQMIASYLAQDAMEYLKHVRDNNLFKGSSTSMLEGFGQCGVNNVCTVDTQTGIISFSSPQLFKSDPDSWYGHSGSLKTPFSRSFYVTGVSNAGSPALPAEAKIVVTVTWRNGTVTNQVVYDNEIYNAIK